MDNMQGPKTEPWGTPSGTYSWDKQKPGFVIVHILWNFAQTFTAAISRLGFLSTLEKLASSVEMLCSTWQMCEASAWVCYS